MDTDTVEYRAFQSCFVKLVNGVKNDLENVATKAFTGKLISDDNLSNAIDRDRADKKYRATKLLQQVLDKIKQNSSNFYTFVTILKEDPYLEELAGELIEKSQSDITIQEPDSESLEVYHPCAWRPRASAVTHDSITLEWDTPNLDASVVSYLVRYRQADDQPNLWKFREMTTNNESNLYITNLTPQTKYIFKVRPELDDGSDGAESEESDPIETKSPPCQPGKPTASVVTHDSITVEWSKPEYRSEMVHSYRVRYCVHDPNETMSYWTLVMTENNETNFIASNLSPQTKFIFKVRPELKDGSAGTESEVSDSFETKVPPCQPGKPVASVVTHDSITVNWSKPEYCSEMVHSYRVRYCVDNPNETHWTLVMTENNETNFIATDLTPNTKYIFKVRPELNGNVDQVGTESEASDLIQTKATSPPGKPFKCSTTHDSISLTWTRPLVENTKIKHYEIIQDSKLMTIAKNSQSQQETVTLQGLSNGTKYIFKVRAVCLSDTAVGMESDPSDPIETNSTSPPGKPTATALSFKSVRLEWTAPEHWSENIDHYVIEYQQDDPEMVHGSSMKKTDGRETDFTVNELQGGTKYTFTVIPHCPSGDGEPSESTDVETPPSCRPGKPYCIASTHNSIKLKWRKPEHHSYYVKHYILSNTVFKEIGPIQGYVAQVNSKWLTSTDGFPVKGLAHNTCYTFTVFPVCEGSAESAAECSISDPISTKKSSPPGKPVKVYATHDSVTLQWEEPEVGSETIDYYKVMYRVHSLLSFVRSITWTTMPRDYNTVCGMATVKGLTLGTRYIFKVYGASTSDEDKDDHDLKWMESEPSDPIETNTTSPPGKPTATGCTHNSITLEWKKPQLGSSENQDYAITIIKDNQLEDKTIVKPSTELQRSGSSLHCTVDELDSRTSYQFIVCPLVNKGTGSCSKISELIMTNATSPPTHLTCDRDKVTHDSIHLKWNCPEHGQERIIHYLLLYTKLEGDNLTVPWETLKVEGEITDYCVENLELSEQYVFKVLPICEDVQDKGTESELSAAIRTKPISAPGKPVATKVTHNSVCLKWTKPAFGTCTKYTVYFYKIASNGKKSLCNNPQESTLENIEVKQLEPGSTYQIHIAPFCINFLGTESESILVTTNPSCVPGKPTASESDITHESITLKWSEPKHGRDQIDHYIVHYKCPNDTQWKEQRTQSDDDENKITMIILGLRHSTQYIFKVCAELKHYTDDLGVDFSDCCQVTTKPLPLAIQMYEEAQSRQLLIDKGPPAVYELPGMTCIHSDDGRKIAKIHFGDPELGRGKQERVLMLFGLTGESKSTLIECMVNYILGVKWEYDFRFQLIKKITESESSEAENQAKFITAYTFYSVPGSTLIDYILTIIDTPDYGDTREPKQDAALTGQIKQFLSTPPPHGIDHIDGVGFVTKAASPRLTATQQYIFDSILGIFGEDMEHKIFLVLTYCDTQQIFQAIDTPGIPNVCHFKFNDNSDNESDTLSPKFWKMGFDILSNFFKEFESVQSTNLQLTRNTLAQHEQLETLVERSQTQITSMLELISNLKLDKEANQFDAESNMPFWYEVEVVKSFREDLKDNTTATICLKCNYTCHCPCTTINDEKLYSCTAMEQSYWARYRWSANKEAHCKVCPGKCHWSEHVNRPYQYEQRQVKEKRTLNDLIKKNITVSPTPSGEQHEDNLIGVAKQLEEAYDKVLDLVNKTQESIYKLNQIALKKSHESCSQVAYIELLIEAEKQGGKDCEQRIEALEVLKDRVQVAIQVAKSTHVHLSLGEYTLC